VLPAVHTDLELLDYLELVLIYHDDVDNDGDIDCDGFNDNILEGGDLFGHLDVQDTCYVPPPDPDTGFINGQVDVVKTGVRVCWDLTLAVGNDTSEIITQVIVRDKFSAELNGVPLEDLPVAVNPVNFGKGKGNKKKSNSALEITWWVDYVAAADTAPPPNTPDLAFTLGGDIDDDDGDKRTPAPGATDFGIGAGATALMLACTKRNPAGKQEYTSPGCYTLNSGLTVKWLTLAENHKMQRFQMSFDEAPPLFVLVPGGELCD